MKMLKKLLFGIPATGLPAISSYTTIQPPQQPEYQEWVRQYNVSLRWGKISVYLG